MNTENEKTKDEKMVDYVRQLENSLMYIYNSLSDEERHAFDLGEMYGMIKVEKEEV